VTAVLEQRVAEDPSLIDKRREALGLDEDQFTHFVEQNKLHLARAAEFEQQAEKYKNSVPELSTPEKFFVGAGQTFSSLFNGAQQLFTGDEGDKVIAAREAHEKALFAKLDDQGIGPEDLGQMAPEVVAFLGGGGLVSFAARGGALGALAPTSGDPETGTKERVHSSLAGGLLSMAGPAVAKSTGAFFNLSKNAGMGLVKTLARWAGNKGGAPAGVAQTVGEAMEMQANTNPAIRELGELALKRTTEIVQRMNTFGKTNTVKELVNGSLTKSVREIGGRNVLDMNQFNRQLMLLSDSQLAKGAGKDFGRMLSSLRNTFTEIGKIAELTPQQAQVVLEGITTSPQAAVLAKQLAKAASPEAKTLILQQIMKLAKSAPRAATAAAGKPAGESVAETFGGGGGF